MIPDIHHSVSSEVLSGITLYSGGNANPGGCYDSGNF